MRFGKTLLLLLFFGIGDPPACFGGPAVPHRGAWVDTLDPTYISGFDADRYTVSIGGRFRGSSRIVSTQGDVLHLCDNGRDVLFHISREGPVLIVHSPGTSETHRLRQLPEWPMALVLKPMELASPQPLSEKHVLEVQGELWHRLALDQAAFRMPRNMRQAKPEIPWLPAPPPQARKFSVDNINLIAVQAENTSYLKSLLARVGWIDVSRFGYPASNAAFLLVQHSYDLPLMTAVLETIKRDVDAGHPMGEAYALLYDRVHLMLGDKQRYGTQVDYDDMGEPMLKPVEEPGTLDERRRALGMMAIGEYLKIFGADHVRISSACSTNLPGPPAAE